DRMVDPHQENHVKSIFCFLTTIVLASSAVVASAATSGTTEKLPSGVVVEQIKPGTGAQPTAEDTVTVNYRGTLANGTEFDSSAKHGGAATFPLGDVIPCWRMYVRQLPVRAPRARCPASRPASSR